MQKFSGAGRIFVLHMSNIYFPNKIIDKNWIASNVHVKRYVFERCIFDAIKSLHTNFGSVLNIGFEFQNMFIDKLNNDAFIGFCLDELHFRSVVIAEFDINILYDERFYLQELTFQHLPLNLNLSIIFGTDNAFPMLTSIVIITGSMQFNTIKSTDLRALSIVQHLDLSHCYIQSIEIGAFNSIANTLVTLKLEGNLLETIMPQIFTPIFDRNNFNPLTIHLQRNELICDCAFIELEALSKLVPFQMDFVPLSQQIDCKLSSIAILLHKECQATQMLSINRLCQLNGYQRRTIYSKFLLTLNMTTKTLVIRSSVKDKYRIWMYSLIQDTIFKAKWGYSIKKCPSKEYQSFTNSKCIISTEKRLEISVEELFATSRINLFCVSYVHWGPVKKMWPLHCIAHGYFNDTKYSTMSKITAGILIVIFGLLFGIAMHLVLNIIILKRKERPISIKS